MIPVTIKVDEGAKVPRYQTEGSAGADIYAFLENDLIVKPGTVELVPTGIYIEIPEGYEAQIRPRSGLALKHGLTLINTPGTIDSDYRGEIRIIVINHGNEEFKITGGMRIAQMVFNKVYRGRFIEETELKVTARNEGGFGHSGV
jgi:dUTP pyrophosphatase